MEKVTTKVVLRHKDLLLVEWIDGVTRRAWVTPDMVVEDLGNLATVLHPTGGVPYGVRWSELMTATISPAEVDARLKQSGIWTAEDLQQQPNVALGILRNLAGDLLQSLLANARALQKGHMED
jgi:hypothetical protein